MTLGFAPRIEWDARIKGRGVVGVGEAADLIHHAQIAWMPAAERRRYALTGPPPPGWFTAMQPAPWIDGHVISEGRKLAGVSLVTVPPVTVPPGQDVRVPAQTRRHVPPGVPAPDTGTRPLALAGPVRRGRRHRAPAARDDEPVTSTGGGGRHRAATPASDTPAGGEELIAGIAAAARYLGYDKPDSFRRARTRHPIPARARHPIAGPAGHRTPCEAGSPSARSPATAPPPESPTSRMDRGE